VHTHELSAADWDVKVRYLSTDTVVWHAPYALQSLSEQGREREAPEPDKKRAAAKAAQPDIQKDTPRLFGGVSAQVVNILSPLRNHGCGDHKGEPWMSTVM